MQEIGIVIGSACKCVREISVNANNLCRTCRKYAIQLIQHASASIYSDAVCKLRLKYLIHMAVYFVPEALRL